MSLGNNWKKGSACFTEYDLVGLLKETKEEMDVFSVRGRGIKKQGIALLQSFSPDLSLLAYYSP